MGTDLFKQGIDREDGSPASTAPVVTDPTGELSFSRTVTSVDTGPKVPSIPEPDPELLALFAPQVDGDFDVDGLGDLLLDRDKATADDDWRDLLDDSIPVRSLAKKSSNATAPLIAEQQAEAAASDRTSVRRQNKKPQRRKRAANKQSRFSRISTTLARPTADRSSTASFARSVDALTDSSDGPARTGSIPRVDPAPEANERPEPASQLAALSKPAAPATVAVEPSSDPVATADHRAASLGVNRPAIDEPSGDPIGPPTAEKPEALLDVVPDEGRNDKTDLASVSAKTGELSILASAPFPDALERPVDTEAKPLTTVRNGVGTAMVRRAVIAGVAAVACLALLVGVLVTGESNDGGTETAADTEALAAQNEQSVDDAEPAPTTTSPAEVGEANEDRTTLDRRAEIAAAGRSLQPSSTVEQNDTSLTSSATASTASAAEGTGSTDGAGDDATAAPSTTTPESTNTSASTPTSVTEPTTCSGVTWNHVLDEGFDGSTIDTRAWAITEGSAGQGVQQASAVTVAGGTLTITAEVIDGTLVSGGVQHLESLHYGRYEARVRTTVDPDGVMGGTVRAAGADGSLTVYSSGDVSSPGTWHTMLVEWTPTSVKYFVDGNLVRTVDDAIPAAAQTLSIRFDASGPTIAAPVTMEIDHVKVWSYGGGC